MTVSSTSRIAGPFEGNGVATSFPFTFKVFAANEVAVFFTNTSGVQTQLGSGYTVTPNADQDASPGGTVTYPNAGSPLAADEYLVLVAATPVTQTTDIANASRFLPTTLENALDRTVMGIQQVAEVAARSLRVRFGEDTDLELPRVADRAGTVLAFNETTGAPEAGPNIAAIESVADASASIATVAGIADDVTDVAGIAASVTDVAGIAANVTTVDGIAANVTTVAGVAANVTTVAGVAASVPTVAGVAANVTTVAGIAANVTTVAGVAASVPTVAGIAADVTAVAAVDTEVAAVGGAISDVSSVAGALTDIGTVADNITAIQQVLAAANLFTTTALGISGTSSGELFGVLQTYGDAADVYLNSAGTAVAQNYTIPAKATGYSTKLAQILERSPLLASSFPVNPTILLSCIDFMDRDGRYVPNRYATQTPPLNRIALSTGIIAGNLTGGTPTEFYANGPQGGITAKRLQLNASGIYDIYVGVVPAGVTTIQCKLKSNTGAGAQTTQFGRFSGSMANQSLTEGAWTTATHTWTSDGVTSYRLSVYNNTGGAQDVLLDEVQFVEGSTVPAFSTERFDGHGGPYFRKPNAIPRTGAAMDTSTTTAPGVVQFNTFPTAKTFTEGTMFAVISTTDTAAVAGKVLCGEGNEGNWDVGNNLGNAYGKPALPRSSSGKNLRISSKGYHILVSRFKANATSDEMCFFLDGIPIKWAANTLASFSRHNFGLFGDPAGLAGVTAGGLPFKGKTTLVGMRDTCLSNDAVDAFVTSLEERHALTGEPAVERCNFWIAEGDSITESATGYFSLFFDDLPARYFGWNWAVSGSDIADVQDRRASIVKQITKAALHGHNPVTSLLIGANGLPTIAQLQTEWAAYRAAGAKVIACTVTPKSDATFNTNRNALNLQIRAASADYDALCDFAADSTIGTDAAGSDVLKYPDGTHPSASTQAIMKTLMALAQASVAV
jgi:hypothetical protein